MLWIKEEFTCQSEVADTDVVKVLGDACNDADDATMVMNGLMH